MLAAFRLTVDDVEYYGGNWHGPLCKLDDVDGLLFVVDHDNELNVTESWLDCTIVSFDVHSLSESASHSDSASASHSVSSSHSVSASHDDSE